MADGRPYENTYRDAWTHLKIISHDILHTAIQDKETEWLDLRGNHDTFDLPSNNHPKNYYRKYSIRGRLNASSYSRHLSIDGFKYSLIGVDFTPSPGPKRPFKYVGDTFEDLNHREV